MGVWVHSSLLSEQLFTVPDFSVVICTYNGEKKVPQVLKKLKKAITAQLGSPLSTAQAFRWEIVVIDNNSSDRTAAVVQQYQADCKENVQESVPLRYYFEPQQGLAFARRRAIQETQSPLIGFLDDDTLPAVSWVAAAVHFGRQHPEVGAYGSSIQGLYEVPPPQGFERIACCLAVIDRGEEPFQYAYDRGVLPAGAGMVIRRQAWLERVPERPQLTGVCAGSLQAKGEDVETLSYIRRGWPIWHNPAMKLSHIIPKERLEPGYLRHLYWRVGISRYALRRLNYRPWLWPLMVALYFISDLKKLLRKLVMIRQISTVERCEFALLLGSLFSPFYHRSIPIPPQVFPPPKNTVAVTSAADTTELQTIAPTVKATVTSGRS